MYVVTGFEEWQAKFCNPLATQRLYPTLEIVLMSSPLLRSLLSRSPLEAKNTGEALRSIRSSIQCRSWHGMKKHGHLVLALVTVT